MMSKGSFWADCRENLKRRSWTVLVGALALFLALPVRLALELSVEGRRIAENPSWLGEMTKREWMGDAFMQIVSNGWFVFLVFLLALLFAVQGFSWLDSRRKLDLYLSVPVSPRRRFAVVYGNGAAVFAVCYFVMLLLVLPAAAVMGALTGEALLYALLMYLVNLLFFLTCYNMALTAVMLTGNGMVSLLAAAVLFFYEPVARWLFDEMRSSFFDFYCDLGDVSELAVTSPVVAFLRENAMLREYFAGYGSRYLSSFGRLIALMAVQAAAYGALSWFLYRKRRAEAAGSALAFERIRTPVKLLLMIPLTLLSGMWFWQLAEESVPFALLGMLIGLFLSHGLLQVLFDFDIRSVLCAKWHLPAAGAAAALIFACFALDLTGYDAYIPKTEQIGSVGVAFCNDSYGFGFYENLFKRDMYHEDPEKYMLKHMESEDRDTVAAVRALAAEAVRREENRGSDRETEPSGSFSGGATDVSIRYTLTDGRKVYRTIRADAQENIREFDAIFADADFQTARYQICDPALLESGGELQISYGNGLNRVSWLDSPEPLLEAYGRDLSKYSCSLMLDSLPVGKLVFIWKGPEKMEYSWEYPVYEAFTETVELLRGQDVYMEPEEGGVLSADQLLSVSITCYNLEEEDISWSDGGSRSITYSPEKEITQVYAGAEQLSRIAPALYPQNLLDVAGNGITGRYWDSDNYQAAVTFRPGERFTEAYLYFTVLEDRLPEFVIEETKYGG